jgi:hypothetical protein
MICTNSFHLGLKKIEPHPKKIPRDGAIRGLEPMIRLLANDIIKVSFIATGSIITRIIKHKYIQNGSALKRIGIACYSNEIQQDWYLACG